MESISEIANTTIFPSAQAFYNSAFLAIMGKPTSAAVLFALAALAAFLTRSVLILIATSILALLTLLASSNVDGRESFVATALGAVSLAIFCGWTVAIRERFARLNRRLRAALKEQAATKDLLNREIAWRQAAEDGP